MTSHSNGSVPANGPNGHTASPISPVALARRQSTYSAATTGLSQPTVKRICCIGAGYVVREPIPQQLLHPRPRQTA